MQQSPDSQFTNSCKRAGEMWPHLNVFEVTLNGLKPQLCYASGVEEMEHDQIPSDTLRYIECQLQLVQRLIQGPNYQEFVGSSRLTVWRKQISLLIGDFLLLMT